MEIIFFALFGIFAGLGFLLCLFLRRLFNFNIVATYILDIIWGASCAILFGAALIKYSSGNFKFFQIFAFILGILITIISLEKLVASIGSFVYNKIVLKLIKSIKSKFKRGLKLWKRKNLPK